MAAITGSPGPVVVVTVGGSPGPVVVAIVAGPPPHQLWLL